MSVITVHIPITENIGGERRFYVEYQKDDNTFGITTMNKSKVVFVDKKLAATAQKAAEFAVYNHMI